MKLAGISALCFLLYILFGCNQTSSHSESITKTDTAKLDQNEIQEKIIDTIFKLTEVRTKAAYIEEQTNGKRHLKIWIVDTLNTDKQKYYLVKAGEYNGITLVTHFNFHVYPDQMRIMYYDTNTDRELTLDEWKKPKKAI